MGDGGLIYIADTNNNRVVCYHSDGRIAREWVPPIMLSPNGVMVDTNGMVYVASGNNCILQYGKDGTRARKWGSSGPGDGEFNEPMGIAKGMDGVLYVADHKNNRIVVLNVNV